jgi:hypothetical protein
VGWCRIVDRNILIQRVYSPSLIDNCMTTAAALKTSQCSTILSSYQKTYLRTWECPNSWIACWLSRLLPTANSLLPVHINLRMGKSRRVSKIAIISASTFHSLQWQQITNQSITKDAADVIPHSTLTRPNDPDNVTSQYAQYSRPDFLLNLWLNKNLGPFWENIGQSVPSSEMRQAITSLVAFQSILPKAPMWLYDSS